MAASLGELLPQAVSVVGHAQVPPKAASVMELAQLLMEAASELGSA